MFNSFTASFKTLVCPLATVFLLGPMVLGSAMFVLNSL